MTSGSNVMDYKNPDSRTQCSSTPLAPHSSYSSSFTAPGSAKISWGWSCQYACIVWDILVYNAMAAIQVSLSLCNFFLFSARTPTRCQQRGVFLRALRAKKYLKMLNSSTNYQYVCKLVLEYMCIWPRNSWLWWGAQILDATTATLIPALNQRCRRVGWGWVKER